MKFLIIRFSSIGDVTQALSIPSFIKKTHPKAEVHFVTRQDLASLLENHPHIDRRWKLDRGTGLKGLFKLIQELRSENYTHIYDAHNNLRSFFIRSLIWGPHKLVKPMMRLKRFLLIRFQINLFEKPFSGQRDLIKPLKKWGFRYFLPSAPQLFLGSEEKAYAQKIIHDFKLFDYFVIVPSAAYFLKRWPLEKWHDLIQLNSDRTFVILAGPTDHFTEALNIYPNVVQLAGKTSLLQSAAIIEQARCVIANDTGLLHIAEQLGRPAVALMGPAPFGFPSRASTKILERNLKCRPCSKHGQGPCKNKYYQECLQSITALEVNSELTTLLRPLK